MTLFTENQALSLDGLLASVKGSQGYYLGLKLNQTNLLALRSMIREQWRGRILAEYPHLEKIIEDYELDDYHRLIADNPEIEHKKLWPKKYRIFRPEVIAQIKRMQFMSVLREQLGDFRIANEEAIYDEEIYWRLVRPSGQGDVGPMHADRWFWDLGHGEMPEGYKRVKIWIPLYCEPGHSGLRYVPASHLHECAYRGVQKDGIIKPEILVEESELNIQLYHTEPGNAVIFNDELLHGGASGGSKSRISLEFTMLVNNEVYDQK